MKEPVPVVFEKFLAPGDPEVNGSVSEWRYFLGTDRNEIDRLTANGREHLGRTLLARAPATEEEVCRLGPLYVARCIADVMSGRVPAVFLFPSPVPVILEPRPTHETHATA